MHGVACGKLLEVISDKSEAGGNLVGSCGTSSSNSDLGL